MDEGYWNMEEVVDGAVDACSAAEWVGDTDLVDDGEV